jgi:hypothetical protein
MSFWSNYVLLKEQQGQSREVTLQQIEAKYGINTRQAVENELPVE